MGKVIAVMQNKGGTLKTTLTTNLAASISLQPQNRVLIIDLDPQANVQNAFGIKTKNHKTVNTLLTTPQSRLNEVVVAVKRNLDVIPGDFALTKLTVEIASGEASASGLHHFQMLMQQAKQAYSHVLIDTAPAVNVFTTLAARVADHIIVPCQMEYDSVAGLARMCGFVKHQAPRARLVVVPTLFDARTRTHKAMLTEVQQIAEKQGFKVSKNVITRSVRCATAVLYHHQPLVFLPGHPKQAVQYHKLAWELNYKQHK